MAVVFFIKWLPRRAIRSYLMWQRTDHCVRVWHNYLFLIDKKFTLKQENELYGAKISSSALYITGKEQPPQHITI